MNMGTDRIGSVTVVEPLIDTLDAGNAKSFTDAMSPLIDARGRVVFDLNRLSFIDSSGCGALLTCYKQAQEMGGRVAFCQVREPVRTVLELIRLNRLIPFFDARETAAAALETNPPDS
jgi:anti-sigma B factor antagonist